MSLILPSIGAFGHTAAGGGDGTRRKLVSTSLSANTGMHGSIPSSTFSSDDITVSFWWKQPGASSGNDGNTVWASHSGQYQLYSGAAGSNDKLLARMDLSTVTTAVGPVATQGDWVFVKLTAGLDFSGTDDVTLVITDGTTTDVKSRTDSGASADDLTAAHTQYVLGDDASGSASDDGFIGEVFDFCVFDGIVDAAHLQHDGSGNWQNLSATGLAALVYRLDGQNVSDPGEDSSGNGLDFTVESGGVTLSATDLPPGANP